MSFRVASERRARARHACARLGWLQLRWVAQLAVQQSCSVRFCWMMSLGSSFIQQVSFAVQLSSQAASLFRLQPAVTTSTAGLFVLPNDQNRFLAKQQSNNQLALLFSSVSLFAQQICLPIDVCGSHELLFHFVTAFLFAKRQKTTLAKRPLPPISAQCRLAAVSFGRTENG